MPIQSYAFKDVETAVKNNVLSRKLGWRQIARIVFRKLDMLDYATEPDDLKVFPGNKLEVLKGDLKGFYSIRVNDKWRIIFKWGPTGPEEVDVVDYH